MDLCCERKVTNSQPAEKVGSWQLAFAGLGVIRYSMVLHLHDSKASTRIKIVVTTGENAAAPKKTIIVTSCA